MIITDNISKQFGPEYLFEGINITFGGNEKYGLIGANGSGKSTFMKILSGELESSNGTVKVDSKKRISTLKQNHYEYEEMTVTDCVIMGHKKLWNIKVERERIYDLPDMTEEESLKVSDLEVQFSDLDGYMAEADAGKLLLGLGIPLESHERKMSSIEPGLKLRVLLAQALFGSPDILLLDEPTNNLDLDTIAWLENVLRKSSSMMIIVSHDRQFLNNICTSIADLDYGEIRLYPGNYNDFMLASTQARQRLLDDNKKKTEKIEELKAFVSRFSANASKAKQATSRANQLNKIELNDIAKSSRVYPFIRFEQKKKIYSNVLDVKGVSKKYDKLSVLDNVDLSIDVGDRIAILGANGIGKSTLLNCLVNEGFRDSGEVKWAINADIAYFAQDSDEKIESDLTLIEWMGQWMKDSGDSQKLRSVLGRLLFSKDDIDKTIDVLSGGEKRRMLFGKMILQEPNVIIMDEPTNHLDMESIESLNTALSLYDGTIIFSSHDREFISSLATRVIELKPGKIIEHNNIESSLKETAEVR